MDTILEIVDLLTLKKIDENTFQGENYTTPWGRVFGGQVLGQLQQHRLNSIHL